MSDVQHHDRTYEQFCKPTFNRVEGRVDENETAIRQLEKLVFSSEKRLKIVEKIQWFLIGLVVSMVSGLMVALWLLFNQVSDNYAQLQLNYQALQQSMKPPVTSTSEPGASP